MKIATIFFIAGMMLMFLFFSTAFVNASRETADFHIYDTYYVVSKSDLYLYLALFFISLFTVGLLVSRRIHKVKRNKPFKKISA